MAAAPPGAVVRITYDARVPVAAGDALVTPSGRTYLVVAARRQEGGKHRGRWHLRCAVAEGPAPAGVTRHRLIWYRRGR